MVHRRNCCERLPTSTCYLRCLHEIHHTPLPWSIVKGPETASLLHLPRVGWQPVAPVLWPQHPTQCMACGRRSTNVGLMKTDAPRLASTTWGWGLQPRSLRGSHQWEGGSCQVPVSMPHLSPAAVETLISWGVSLPSFIKAGSKSTGTVARICCRPDTGSHSHDRPHWKTIFL